jgi:hypothetical protein
MRISLLAVFTLLLSQLLISQEASTLREAFLDSEVNGYFRSFYSYSDNDDGLKDFSALGVGGKLGFETKRYKNFSVGAYYYSTFNTNITDLTKPDPATGKLSRYELGLFDIHNPSEREVSYLGELFISYKNKGHFFKIGRQSIRSPLLNIQDGRMIPTLHQGITYKNTSFDHHKFSSGIINAVAARSSNGYKAVNECFGVYSQGLKPSGGVSDYRNHTQSNYLAFFNWSGLYQNMKIHFWDYYIDNVSNTAILTSLFELGSDSSTYKPYLGAQFIRQDRINYGGNKDPDKRYFDQDESITYGAKIGVKRGDYSLTLNANHVTDQGRFLFPRSWGIETGLFTFQRRERTEGMRDASNIMIQLAGMHQFKWGGKVNFDAAYGRYYRSEPNDPLRNKYGFPSHDQMTFNIGYHFSGYLDGLNLQLFVLHKPNRGNTYDNPNFILHKVDMTVYNAVVNYVF